MNCYYHTLNKCIAFIHEQADSTYWDGVWNSEGDWSNTITPNASKYNRAIKLISSVAVKENSSSSQTKSIQILEAGSGMGQYVYWLTHNGYQCTGIDYAKETVDLLNSKYPELDIREMDVFDLSPLEDGSFDVYYSGGVIEHFWNGYDGILKEADRVLQPGGKMILTFPFMSRSRKSNSKNLPSLVFGSDQKNEFEIIHNDGQKTPANSVPNEVKSSFYQFALDPNSVINNLKDNYGYKLTHKSSRNGLKGFNEAHPSFPIVLKLYNYRGASKLMKGARYILGDILARLGYGHTIEMIFVKPS